MMMLIKILLLFACIFVYGQSTICDLCIMGSTCDDDYIHFNISVSNKCPIPLDIYYTYYADIDSEKHRSNVTIECQNCYVDLAVEPIHDAWDYYLTLESPDPTDPCAVHEAQCGGQTTELVWIVTAGLTGIFILSGALLGIIRYCRTQRRVKTTQKKIQAAVINA